MSSFKVPELAEVATMSPADLESFARAMDRERRIIEAKIATFVHRVGESGGYLHDKHRTPKTWGQSRVQLVNR